MDESYRDNIIDLGEVKRVRELKARLYRINEANILTERRRTDKNDSLKNFNCCVFCKKGGNLISYKGKPFCTDCYHELMGKIWLGGN